MKVEPRATRLLNELELYVCPLLLFFALWGHNLKKIRSAIKVLGNRIKVSKSRVSPSDVLSSQKLGRFEFVLGLSKNLSSGQVFESSLLQIIDEKIFTTKS